MKQGLTTFQQYGVKFQSTPTDTFTFGILPNATGPASNISWYLPRTLPGSTQAITVDSSGNIGYTALGGGGTVTSVDAALPTSVFSASSGVITTTGTLTFTFNNQTGNVVFASPANGTSGVPSFRGLVYADISSFVGSSASQIAAGNDSRFHTQNTDTGTTSATFQLNSGSSGVKIKDSSGELQIRNSGDSAYADLRVNNLTVTGTSTTLNTETVTVDDNIIVLNNNVTSGSPSEDGGIQIRRGASTSASLIWDETNDLWKAGLAGSEVRLTRTSASTFTNASLTSNVLIINPGLSQQYGDVIIIDNNNKKIIPDEVTYTSSTSWSIDLTSYGTISGTWQFIAIA